AIGTEAEGMTTAALPPSSPAVPGRRRGATPGNPAPAPLTVLEPARGWQGINLGEVWRYRELVYFLVWRDVKVRYKQTVLGAAWALFQPLLMMAVFTLFFRGMAGVSCGELPYPLFAFAGFLPWTFFASA